MAGDTISPQPINPEAAATEAGVAEAERFLEDIAPHLGRLFGMDLNIRVGQGWATDMETGEVTADPRFFIERGYTPDMASYAVLHETAAHLKEAVTEPSLNARAIEFMKGGKANGIFYNIFTDIAGNNLIHAALPRMRHTAEQLYSEKLFPDTHIDEETGQEMRYSDLPRHMQFLYKIIREEMLPESETVVSLEVQAAIDGLRDYEGQGDLIKYSTAVAKSAREAMPGSERFAIWTGIIYPVYEKLLQQDRDDPQFQPGEGDGQPQDDEPQDGDPQQGQSSPTDSDAKQFSKQYKDYDENKHPEPMSEEDHAKMHDHAKKQEQQSSPRHMDNHERMLDQKLREETGHSLYEQRQYDAEVLTWQPAIEEMREVFQQVIQERVSVKRGLTRRTLPEGAILDPDRLSQVVIDMRSGATDPEVFRDYEAKKGQTESVGKTDYVFLFDVSGSMNDDDGSKAKSAASSAVIGLEGLAALQRDVEEAEATHKMELDLDIRTAMYTFGVGSTCLKPLSSRISPKERLDAYSALRNAHDGQTNDFVALEEIQQLPEESDRRRILIVVSDGESHGPVKARRAVDALRGSGWFVYGIGIGSDEATNLYKPTSRRVDDPNDLPRTIYSFIEATVS